MIRALCCIAAALLLAGCIDEAPGPADIDRPPGEVAFQMWWDASDRQAKILNAVEIVQEGSRFQNARLLTVTLRMPMEDGSELILFTPEAHLDQSEGGDGDIRLDPPVKLSGTLGMQPVMGLAQKGTFFAGERTLELEDVELLYRGQYQQTDKARIIQGLDGQRFKFANPRSRGSALPIGAALANLPPGLSFPPFNRADSASDGGATTDVVVP